MNELINALNKFIKKIEQQKLIEPPYKIIIDHMSEDVYFKIKGGVKKKWMKNGMKNILETRNIIINWMRY